ncbi:hypothetical protein GSH10_17005 [Burkholderia pseudomallei]|nr:hypothetical protein [Burkholderia pseudomallei]
MPGERPAQCAAGGAVHCARPLIPGAGRPNPAAGPALGIRTPQAGRCRRRSS